MTETTTIVIGCALFLIMLGMGLSLVLDNFKNVLKQPKAIAIGLLNQLILLPIIAFSILYVFPISPEVAVGLMILSACPGGAVSNLICYLAKADLALSVSLTAISSIFSVFTIPLIINFSLAYFIKKENSINLSLLETIIQIAVIIIIPIIIGMLIRHYKPLFASRIDKLVRTVSIVILLTLITGVLIKERNNLLFYLKEAGLTTLLLNIFTISTGYITAKTLKLKTPQALSIAIESGIQNSALAMSIAIVLLKNIKFAIAPSIYTLSMYLTGGLIIYIAINPKINKT